MTIIQDIDTQRAEQLKAFASSLYSKGDPRATRLMDQLRQVSHQMYRLGEASLNEAGFSYAQYRVLMSLLFNEWLGHTEGMNPSEISAQQGTGRNTVSALIRTLEDDGLIERRLDENDRRRFNIALTDAGRQRVRQHANSHMQFVDHIFTAFSDEELETLGALLQKLNQCAQSFKEQGTPPHGGLHATSQ
ncbi:MAG: winged helix-turn-helix transcriptional regulator [Candidatus Promineofilum sp.]|nr:winged helix-turn-helix transcriptional regulator [Promineifilum sp.]